jgi:hypothetical protein
VPSLRRIAVLTALASLALAAPAAAQGGGGAPQDQGGAPSTQQNGSPNQSSGNQSSGSVSSRVRTRLNRAGKSLQNASDAIDNGDNAKAQSGLKAVASNFAAAEKAAKKHASPANYGAVADASHEAIGDLASLFDGVTDTDTVNQIGTTLNAVISGRDDLISTIGGLSDKSNYADVVQEISDDVADEISSVQDALSDDTLKDPEAKDALNAALTKLQATASTVSSLLSSLGGATSQQTPVSQQTPAAGNQGQRDCPRGQGDQQGAQSDTQGGPRHGPPGQPGQGTGQQVPA